MSDLLTTSQAFQRVSRALALHREGDSQPLIQLLQRHRRLPISADEWIGLLSPICPNLPNVCLHPALLPPQLLADPFRWQPTSSGIDEAALLAAHPDLGKSKDLTNSPILPKILCGELSLYIDLPPVALTAYAAELRVTERKYCRQEKISVFSHLANRGWQLFRRGVSASKVLDRFVVSHTDPDNHTNLSQEACPQLLVVLDADQATALRQAACGGWSQVVTLIAGEISTLAESLAQLPGNTLVSFCHATDKLNAQASHRVAAAAAAQPEATLISSDELIEWADYGSSIAGNRQCRVAPTPLRLLIRGALGGIVSIRASDLLKLQLPDQCTCLHAFLLSIALQLAQRTSTFGHCCEELLTRNLQNNPNIPDVATPRDRLVFSEQQHEEIVEIVSEHAGPLLAPGGRLEPHPSLRGCLRLALTPPIDTLISILIPFRDRVELTKACVSSIRRFAGSVAYELILIDNGSQEASTTSWLEEQAALHDVQIVRLDMPFNYARLNNLARPYCRGSHLLLLNNDIEFAGANVLSRLLDPFGYVHTSAVGARLLFPDGSIQHQGVVLTSGERGCLREPGKHIREPAVLDTLTPLLVQEEFVAASGACLLISANKFDEIGGFNEEFEVTFNDVDLCLRLRRHGGCVVVTPEPRLIHHESISRGKDHYGTRLSRHANEQGLLRHNHSDLFAHGDPLTSQLLKSSTTKYELSGPAISPICRAREQILYSWRRPRYRASSIRPLLMFAQFSNIGRLRPDVLSLLQAYRNHADVVFVGATPELLEQPSTMRQLRRICSVVLIRRNEGYDFGSWMSALSFCAEDLRHCRELILTNDSFYGPIMSLDSLFRRLQNCKADVVGLTDNLLYHHHLQSAFLLYRHPVITSEIFCNFWQNLQIWPSKRELVRHCEVDLTVQLRKSGYRLASIYSQNANGNILHFRWKQLIEEQDFPFLKVSLLRDNPTQQDINDWPEVVGRHNPALARQIQAHLASLPQIEDTNDHD